MAKVWKKLQRADGDFTGTWDGVQKANVYHTTNKPSKSDVGLSNVDNDSTSTIRSGVTKSDVGLANVDNESKASILGGAFTGTIGGTSASTIKTKAEAAKDAVDGNAAVTMVGGSINIGSGEWTVDTNGNQVTKGTITINKDSGGDAGLTLDSGNTGTMQIMMEGANPTIDMGGTDPLGTTTLQIRRGGTGNQCRIFFRNDTTAIGCVGFANQPSAHNAQFAIHTSAIYDNTSPYEERALSFDSDNKSGWFCNTKTFAGFTFGTDGTNQGVYIKDGGLSIGHTDSTYKLEVHGDIRLTNKIYAFEDDQSRVYTREWLYFGGGHPSYKTGADDKYHNFKNYSGTNIMSVGGSGNRVGIQCTPSYELDVDGDARIQHSIGVGTTPHATDGRVDASNDVIAFASDKRLKEDVEPISDALDKIDKLTGITYVWNAKASEVAGFDNRAGKSVGVYAQDVKEVLPEAVKLAPFDNDGNDGSLSGEEYLTVQYERIVPLLIESIKELKSEVKELKEKCSGCSG
jgi:hypothetical protein